MLPRCNPITGCASAVIGMATVAMIATAILIATAVSIGIGILTAAIATVAVSLAKTGATAIAIESGCIAEQEFNVAGGEVQRAFDIWIEQAIGESLFAGLKL